MLFLALAFMCIVPAIFTFMCFRNPDLFVELILSFFCFMFVCYTAYVNMLPEEIRENETIIRQSEISMLELWPINGFTIFYSMNDNEVFVYVETPSGIPEKIIFAKNDLTFDDTLRILIPYIQVTSLEVTYEDKFVTPFRSFGSVTRNILVVPQNHSIKFVP